MFYYYSQNNSRGKFRGPGHYVIVEADSAEHADKRAEEIGLYFDGCATGLDCPCCGDRWTRQYKEGGNSEPCIYDSPVNEYLANTRWGDNFARSCDAEAGCAVFIYYLNGEKKKLNRS